MRPLGLSLGTLGAAAVTSALVFALAAPAVAAPAPWFGPAVQTSVPNGAGPGPAPRGTVTADFNRDGRPDLVSISQFTAGGLLFFPGQGGGTFGSPTQIAGTGLQFPGGGVQGIDAGDLNGDGNPDVVGMTATDVLIEFGDGHGGFTFAGSYAFPLGGQIQPRLVDLDADGSLDIVAPSFGFIETLINDGTGHFRAGPNTVIPGSSVLSGITPATINRDARADLFAIDGTTGTTYSLLGRGNGSFTVAGRLFPTSFIPEDVAAIDLNGDGCDDVAVVGSFSFSLTTALTTCSGSFATGPSITYGGAGPTSLTAADYNHDGRTDLAVSSLIGSTGTIRILAGNGTVNPTLIGDNAVGPFPQNPVVADFTGDGKPDIVTAGVGNLTLLPNIT